MNGLSIWHYLIIIAVLALIGFVIYSAFKARKNNDLKGIYGWLLFFVIILGVTAISLPAQVYSEYSKVFLDYPELRAHDEFQIAYQFELAIAWLQSAIFLYLIYILKTKKIAGTIKTVITGIWIAGLGCGALNIALIMIFTPNLFPFIVQSIPAFIISPIVFGTVWTLYFKKSRRVKNTYPSLVFEPPKASYGEGATFIDNEVKDYTKKH